MTDTAEMRELMVKCQIQPCDVTSTQIAEAFNTTSKEKFVPRQLKRIAYMDDEFPLPHGRFMLRPQTLAKMISISNPQPHDRVLHIGCGLGYGSAILSKLCNFVVGLEFYTDLSQQAEEILGELGVSGVEIVNGPLNQGWDEYSPYSLIFIEGRIEYLPHDIESQLQDGGRIVAIKQQPTGRSECVIMYKNQGVITELAQFDARCPYLEGFQSVQDFVFAG